MPDGFAGAKETELALRRFVSLEGGEGTGKSTQTRRLADQLQARGFETVATREPGGAPFAEAIRSALLEPRSGQPSHLAQALAFNAARADHLIEVVRPALARGAFVVCDRFVDSTRVYQCYAGDLAPEIASDLDRIVVGGTMPALTIILDLDPSEGLARARVRRDGERADKNLTSEADMFEARALAYHQQIRAGFLDIAAREPERCVVCDASLPPDPLFEVIWRQVAARFSL